MPKIKFYFITLIFHLGVCLTYQFSILITDLSDGNIHLVLDDKSPINLSSI